MSESKWREFWILGFKTGPDESISQNCLVNIGSGGSAWMPHHHVIEYGALQELKEENARLTKELETIDRANIIAERRLHGDSSDKVDGNYTSFDV